MFFASFAMVAVVFFLIGKGWSLFDNRSPAMPSTDWRHDSRKSTPPEESWACFNKQIEQAITTGEKLEVLAFWVQAGIPFTFFEETEVLGMFHEEEERRKARQIFSDGVNGSDEPDEQDEPTE